MFSFSSIFAVMNRNIVEKIEIISKNGIGRLNNIPHVKNIRDPYIGCRTNLKIPASIKFVVFSNLYNVDLSSNIALPNFFNKYILGISKISEFIKNIHDSIWETLNGSANQNL